MEILQTGLLIVAITGSIWQLLAVRKAVVTGGVVIPSYVVAVLCFSLCTLVVLIFRFSPFHLLWLFVMSLGVGVFSLFFPPAMAVAALCITVLSLTRRNKDSTPPNLIDVDPGTRRNKPVSRTRKFRAKRRRRRR